MSIKSALRSLVYDTEKLMQRLRFASLAAPVGGWPILLSISFPKSGTHLLDQILLGFSEFGPFPRRLRSFYAEYEGETGRRRSPQDALAWLDSLLPADAASAHLFAQPEAVTRVASPAFVPYFIFRDPRDVVVSHVFYVTEMEPRHVHHDYYAGLPDFDSRLSVSILGRPDIEIEFPDIAGRFAPYLAWLHRPEVLSIHFEDLVNHQARELERILDHFLRRVPSEHPRAKMLEALEAAINPDRSPTFRSGKTGEWRKYFTAAHKKMFKEATGELLIELGYETSHDW